MCRSDREGRDSQNKNDGLHDCTAFRFSYFREQAAKCLIQPHHIIGDAQPNLA
jgi:hypothetical protein